MKKKKVEVSKSIDILKTSLTSAAIASGSAGTKAGKMQFRPQPLQQKCRRRKCCWRTFTGLRKNWKMSTKLCKCELILILYRSLI